ncbi:Uncharacterised protein [Bordetella pertussis]|nr:Uncharacterised protein [Bordetella pertussis]CFO28084.1 Uncharacterised protein [Bordetella pertussis]CFT93845.1 Uncharacterised protein [Bordetella pertussis]CPH99806.1 Uncharacterised protein [Bordetella pertussis]CPI33064.1 Uncharacterised protein [Bordetella pertussis]
MAMRSPRSPAARSPVMSSPSKTTLPAVTAAPGGNRPSTVQAIVLLPEPLSPTMPSDAPRGNARSTPCSTWLRP